MVKIMNVGLLLGLILSLYACGACTNIPEVFCIKVIGDSNKNLLGTVYQKKDIELYSIYGQDTVQVEFRFSEAQDGTIYLESIQLGLLASGKTSEAKTFYLKLRDAAPDVLYVDVRRKNSGTCSYFEYERVLFNGKRPEIDQSTIPFMYVLKK